MFDLRFPGLTQPGVVSSMRGLVLRGAWFLLLVVGVGLIYLPGLGHPLVFDDLRLLAERGVWVKYANPLEIKPRWLSYQTFILVEALFGEGWWKQRLVNVLLHVIVAWSIYVLFCTLMRNRKACEGRAGDLSSADVAALRIGVLLYAFNPVAVYAVAYLIQRSIVMATLFVVLGLIAYLRMLEHRRLLWLVVAVLCFGFAVLSKEHALMAPVVALLMHCFLRDVTRQQLLLMLVLPSGLIALGGWILTRVYPDVLGVPFDDLSRHYVAELSMLQPALASQVWLISALNQMTLFFYHAVLWFVPVVAWMSIDLRPPFPLSPVSPGYVVGALVFVGLIVGALWMLFNGRARQPWVALCILSAMALFGTELVMVWIQDPLVLYRGYLWAIVVPGLVWALLARFSVRTIYLGGGAVLLVFAFLAGERVHSMSTGEKVWDDAVRKTSLFEQPNAVGRWRPYLNRGADHLARMDLAAAEADFRLAVSLGDPLGFVHLNLGRVLMARDDFAEAVSAFDEAERRGVMRFRPTLYLYRSEAKQALGLEDAALADLRTLAKSPDADEPLIRQAESKIQMLEFMRMGPRGPVNMPLPIGGSGR